ncbi:MAG: hypothetical protein P0Y56_13135 [Candidatus Andeanibacterium colombiense]|uniref:Uncharacterized protein n=1 Tax=Candidatus Andeanibacterium colombiense TaxID=3121345 RepID=A0AAJ5X8D1_9SPHN|nr:MAG: hypothetical protein P0Y56_13135 [Sphingomonadaceae bacterium]
MASAPQLQPLPNTLHSPRVRLHRRRPELTSSTIEKMVLEEVHRSAAQLVGALRVELDPADRDGWIDRQALRDPETEPFADLHARFTVAGFACNRKAAAASLLLRYGWAAGFQIAAWLDRGLVLHLDEFALKFSSSTLVEAVWAKDVRIDEPADEREGRRLLLKSLLEFTEPLVAAQHGWSRFSRHALWSMVVSSWAAQFASIGERLGRRDEAVREAELLFAFNREIGKAAPETYVVHAEKKSRVCQKRSACCLYFKGPAKHFCASCPIIPREERLERNREFTACSTGG